MSTSQALVGPSREGSNTFPQSSGVPFAARIAAAALIAYVPVLVAATGHGTAGWGVAVVLAVVLAGLPRFFDAESLACALVPTAALTLSGLVQPASQYMALGTIAGGFAARYLLDRRTRSVEALTPAVPRVLIALVGGYVLWAALTSVFSIDRRTSAVYLAGMALALAVAFWFVPHVLATGASWRRFLATVVAAGLAMCGVTVLLGIVGPLQLYGLPFGNVLMIEPTILHQPTGLVFPRVFGPYIDPGPYYTVIAAALIASFILRAGAHGRGRFVAMIAGLVVAAGLLTSDSRAGWLMVAAGGLVWTALNVRRGRVDWFAGSITALFGVALAAVLFNLVGADVRFDVQVERGWPAWVVAGKLESGAELLKGGPRGALRGGTSSGSGFSLTERDELWRASLAAARRRPLVGYGPGTDVPAIAPYLNDRFSVYRGVSSHSTWLRTLVEMGVVGLLLAAAVWLAVLVVAAARLRLKPTLIDDPTFVVLLAWVIAFLADQFFETYLLGGLGIYNLLAAIALGTVAARASATDS